MRSASNSKTLRKALLTVQEANKDQRVESSKGISNLIEKIMNLSKYIRSFNDSEYFLD
jgi:hypothetical protein